MYLFVLFHIFKVFVIYVVILLILFENLYEKIYEKPTKNDETDINTYETPLTRGDFLAVLVGQKTNN